jgi:hypothetical protein
LSPAALAPLQYNHAFAVVNTVLESYRAHVAERAALGIPPLPLTAEADRRN